MLIFKKPENLNGAELVAELASVGIVVNNKTSPRINDDGDLVLDMSEADKAKATPIVAAHNGTIIPPEPTVADKLASAGLTVDELKAALGL